jgi:hypothetical protein
MIDTLWRFSGQDLQAIQNLGFSVMGPEDQWLVVSDKTQCGYMEINSSISQSRHRK